MRSKKASEKIYALLGQYKKLGGNMDIIEELRWACECIASRTKYNFMFYLEYKDKPSLLFKHHPWLKGEVKEFVSEKKDVDIDKYNAWLFKLAYRIFWGFKGGKEDGKKKRRKKESL